MIAPCLTPRVQAVSSKATSYILTANTLDIPGVVANVSRLLLEAGANVTEAAQFGDDGSSRFFLRMAFCVESEQGGLRNMESLEKGLDAMKSEFDIQWSLYDAAVRPKIVLAVSRFGHCLNDLLYRWEANTLSADIVAVVSNHEDMRKKTESYGVPYYYFSVTSETKVEQEKQILQVMEDSGADLLVLARYMQILSEDMCRALNGRAINIHHSFLPSFKGARPYHQAFDRGVKIIGATAHYVTEDLDEGPIIEQDVERAEHYHRAIELTRKGSDIECQVLARAVNWHCEHRILLNGHKTVVFK
ncbi:MAG: formyltetrahydrofolate deformylase [bacterium]